MAYPKIVNLIKKALIDKKADDIKIYKTNNSISDYIILCTSLNSKNANAIADSVEEVLQEENFSIKHIEGKESSKWIVLDCYDVIVHIFDTKSREYYRLDEIL